MARRPAWLTGASAFTAAVTGAMVRKYRLTVIDCDQPRNSASYVIRPNGAVREIRDN